MDSDPLAELNRVEKEALVELAKARADGSVSRRDALQAGGLLAGGALLGGGAGFAATGKASADASTADGDGDVGQPGDRVDLFADGVDANSVSTESAAINRQRVTPHDKQGNQRRVFQSPLSVAEKTRIITPSDFTGQDIYWPSFLKASEVFDNPLGEYYCYFSEDHVSGSSIGLAYADDPMGSWTVHGEVLSPYTSDNETPSAIHDPENGRVNVYFHSKDIGTTQSTALATTPESGDGTSFANQGLVLDVPSGAPGDGHTGYFSPSRVGQQWVGYHLMGGGDNARFGVSYSDNGEDWQTDPRPLVANVDMTNNNGRRVEWSHSKVINWGGGLTWFGSVSPFSSGGSQTDARVAAAALKSPRTIAAPKTLISPTDSWEGTGTITPDVLIDGGETYVGYASGGSIGVARLTEAVL